MGSDDHEWYAESGGDGGGRYRCAFCGEEIEPVGFDPCEVSVQAARSTHIAGDERDPGMWWFYTHAACLPHAMCDDFRTQFEREYAPPMAD
jgi:hypothetical protein